MNHESIGIAVVESEESGSTFQVLNAAQLAERLNLPESWIREMTRSRTADPIPHARFGHYVRFFWPAPELIAWIARRMKGGKNEQVGEGRMTRSKNAVRNSGPVRPFALGEGSS